MNPIKPIIRISVFAIFLLPCLVRGQSDCSELLRESQRLFDAGKLDKAVKSIEGCWEKGKFSNEERIQALRLVTLYHLDERNKQQVDSTFKELLHRDPEFKVDLSLEGDPADLVELYRSFRTSPRFHLRIHTGGNLTQVRELQFLATVEKGLSEKTFSFTPGVQLGGLVAIPLWNRNIRLQLGAEFQRMSFRMEHSLLTFQGDLPFSSPRGNRSPDFFRIRLKEDQQYLQVPVSISIDFDKWSSYNFDRKEAVIFFFGGITYHQMLTASYSEISKQSGVGSFISSSSFDDLRDLRYDNNVSLHAGAGLKAKVGRNYVVMNLCYNQWLQNIANPETRYSNSELIYRYGQIDSDFTFSTLSSFLGLEIPFYVPARRKWAK